MHLKKVGEGRTDPFFLLRIFSMDKFMHDRIGSNCQI